MTPQEFVPVPNSSTRPGPGAGAVSTWASSCLLCGIACVRCQERRKLSVTLVQSVTYCIH